MSKDEGFTTLVELKDPDGMGVVAIITTKRRPTGYMSYSFALKKEFELNGETKRSAFLQDRHIGAARKLLDMVEERIREEQDKLFTTRRHGR